MSAAQAKAAGASAAVVAADGTKSPDGFRRAADPVTEVLPHARHETLPGLNHGAVVMAPEKITPSLTAFLRG